MASGKKKKDVGHGVRSREAEKVFGGGDGEKLFFLLFFTLPPSDEADSVIDEQARLESARDTRPTIWHWRSRFGDNDTFLSVRISANMRRYSSRWAR